MRKINRDNIPHLVNVVTCWTNVFWCTVWVRLNAKWWGVHIRSGCKFRGFTTFRRYPGSHIEIGEDCQLFSSPTSNLIGINRPCIISTLKEGAQITIGSNCGLSGTVIGCAVKIILGERVRCGANTLITDTDWHTDDYRVGLDAQVTIENNVWLGANVSVMKGVTIGENTVVAAGSMVTRSLPANVVAGGFPAKVLKQLDPHQAGSKQ